MACKRIIWAGRLSHAKGRLGMKLATEIFPMFKDVQFEIYAGPLPDKEVTEANQNVRFFGVVNNLLDRMKGADLVVGGGRVALEAMTLDIPVMAVGQKCYVGILKKGNIKTAMETNFGDMHQTEFIDYQQLTKDLTAFIAGKLSSDTGVYSDCLKEYQLDHVAEEIRKVYEQAVGTSRSR